MGAGVTVATGAPNMTTSLRSAMRAVCGKHIPTGLQGVDEAISAQAHVAKSFSDMMKILL
jgi:hypothetical protein